MKVVPRRNKIVYTRGFILGTQDESQLAADNWLILPGTKFFPPAPVYIEFSQGFINEFFFLFLDERNNWVRVTNCQSPLSPTKFFDLRRQRQPSDRPPGHGGPNFLFLELETGFINNPQVRKACRPLRPILCALCLAIQLSMRLLSFSFTTFYCRWSCHS